MKPQKYWAHVQHLMGLPDLASYGSPDVRCVTLQLTAC